jgi:hypothetical protein
MFSGTCTPSDGRIVDYGQIAKDLRETNVVECRCYSAIFLEGLRKTVKNLTQDNRYPRIDSNQTPL